MGSDTKIEWTDATWNPILGCSRVSEGCRNCYAEGIAARFGNGEPTVYSGLTRIVNGHAQWTGKVVETKQLLDPLRWRQPKRVFVNSMSDLFHENVTDEQRDRIFAVMALSPRHTFQVLTKRPENMLRYFLSPYGEEMRPEIAAAVRGALIGSHFPELAPKQGPVYEWSGMPMTNVWLGVSVEHQAAANERIPLLLKTPAAIRFISAEPLLGAVDLREIRYRDEDVDCLWNALTAYHEVLNSTSMDIIATADDGVTKLDWVICGGESGPGARPMHPDWARSLRDQCQAAAGVPFFFKQWGAWMPADGYEANAATLVAEHVEGDLSFDERLMQRIGKKAAGAELDGRVWRQFPEPALPMLL